MSSNESRVVRVCEPKRLVSVAATPRCRILRFLTTPTTSHGSVTLSRALVHDVASLFDQQDILTLHPKTREQ